MIAIFINALATKRTSTSIHENALLSQNKPQIDNMHPEPGSKPNLIAYLKVLEGWLGRKEEDNSEDDIIRIYNSQRVEPYEMLLTDAWCQATVTAAAYVSGNQGYLPNTALCTNGIIWFKNQGLWHSRGTIDYDPQIGDIIYYDWNGDGSSEHVGTCIKRDGNMIVVREGNHADCLSDREIQISDTCILGYGRPQWNGNSDL